ncbi:MAG: phenylalanine--tRNA ligase subunit beta [Candidatus Micrarchaeota archaeon]
MVNIIVNKKALLKRIGVSEEKALDALPQIKAGIEADECGELTLEIRADRPDLLSVQGVARAVKGFLGVEKGLPELRLLKSPHKVIVDKSVEKVRPVIVTALIEGVKIDEQGFKDLIQTQEKLTLTHGRRRRKVAIGVHDAAPIKFPLVYKAVPKNSPVEFVPLLKTEKMTLAKVMREHEKGLEYGFTLEGFSHYPVIFDSDDDIISFPPIINSAKTAVTAKTTSLFIDITGTDFEACNSALNILCQDYADEGARVYSIRTGGRVTPEITPEKMSFDAKKASQLIGLDLNQKQIADCLQKQRIGAKAVGKEKVEALIPRFRTDFLHWADLVEEIAIGYGYNRFEPKAPSVFTIGRMSEETATEEKLRDLLVGAGFVEQWTYVLTSSAKHAGDVVKIKNPVSSDYDALRSTLLLSLFETLSKNTHEPYPQKVFEIGEVVVKDAKHSLRTVSQKRLACVSAHSTANLSEISGLALQAGKGLNKSLALKKTENAHFIPGRCVGLWFAGKEIGVAGEVHPSLLEKLQVEVPAVAFEIIV